MERRELRGDPREGRTAVAGHSLVICANARHVSSAVQERDGCAAVDDTAGRCGDESIRCQRLDLSDLGLREARCWYDAGLQWRHRKSARLNKGENLDPHRYQGFAQSRIRA